MSMKLSSLHNRVALGQVEQIESPQAGVDSDAARPAALSSADRVLWQQLSQYEYAVLDNPSDPYLEQYMGIVRNMLKQALKRHRAELAPYWSPTGRFRQMVHVVQVNDALEAVVTDIRSGHVGTELARRLDIIRGLLVDLWT